MAVNKLLQKFFQTLKHSDLPKGWQDNPEIVEEAGRLYREMGTESPFFKAWFGKSKVVDEAGTPLPVYHGTPNKFESFDYGRRGDTGRSEGVGFYFTPNKEVASSYGTPLEAYVSAQKPMPYDRKPFTQSQIKNILLDAAKSEQKEYGYPLSDTFLSNFGDIEYSGLQRVLNDASSLFKGEPAVDQIGGMLGSGIPAQSLNQAVTKSTGYDATIAKGFSNENAAMGNIFVAMHPEQIKSIFNRGTFDPSDPNILRGILPYIIGGGAATAALAPSESEAANIGPRGFRNLFGSELTETTPGAFRGAEGMLRYEIPDNEMRLTPDFSRQWMDSDSTMPAQAFLDDAISHPQLFQAYPQLREFDLSAARTPQGLRGAAYADGMMAEAPSLRQLMDVITHENQHGIQGLEGFAGGTTPAAAGGYRQYIDAPGEREARMVEARRRLTPEQRQTNPQGGLWGAAGLGTGYGKDFGSGLRDVLTGLTSIPDMAINPFLNLANSLAGGDPNYFKSSGGALADILGLPKTDEDSLPSMVTQSVAGGLPMAGVGMAMQAGKRLPDLARVLSQYRLPDLGIDVGMGGLGYAVGGGR